MCFGRIADPLHLRQMRKWCQATRGRFASIGSSLSSRSSHSNEANENKPANKSTTPARIATVTITTAMNVSMPTRCLKGVTGSIGISPHPTPSPDSGKRGRLAGLLAGLLDELSGLVDQLLILAQVSGPQRRIGLVEQI